jgi:hypothetical protein
MHGSLYRKKYPSLQTANMSDGSTSMHIKVDLMDLAISENKNFELLFLIL